MEIPGGQGGQKWTWEPWKVRNRRGDPDPAGGNSRPECRTRFGLCDGQKRSWDWSPPWSRGQTETPSLA